MAIYIPWFDSGSADTVSELSGTWRPLQVTNLQLLPQIVLEFFFSSSQKIFYKSKKNFDFFLLIFLKKKTQVQFFLTSIFFISFQNNMFNFDMLERILLIITIYLVITASINLGFALFSLARTIYDIWFQHNLVRALTEYGFILANRTGLNLLDDGPIPA